MNTPPYVYNLGAAFLIVANAHPDRPALRFGESGDISYRDLATLSLHIAQGLSDKGVKRGDLIAIQNEKSLHGLSAMLACLLLGVAYTNLDPLNPVERITRILQSCQPKFILCDGEPSPNLTLAAAELGIEISPIEALARTTSAFDISNTRLVTGNTTAYVMFTSGSTGTPKGVAVSHASVLNFTGWARETFAITPSDVLAGVNPIYFDNSVFDFYAALFNGACLVPLKKEAVASPHTLPRLIDDAGCTIWFSVPSLLIYLRSVKALSKAVFKSVRAIIFGGEGYPLKELAHLYDLFADRATLFNVYGPTECTCICSSYAITKRDFEDGRMLAPLGHMAPNFDYAILDGDANTPLGEVGELCLIGPQVAQGYYNDPDRTAQAFVRNPVHPAVAMPMYRTGDMVREIDGMLHFVGRKDNQIKHMGYRIELDEIEAAISCLPYVSQAAVVYKRSNERFGSIIAHIASSAEDLDAARLRQDLTQKLPAYMIPDRFLIVDTLAKNANGKVDRNALRDISVS